MAIKYTNIFKCKTLQNLPKLVFWFENTASGNPDSGNSKKMSAWPEVQGCQIFLGTTHQNGKKHIKDIPNGRQIFQMAMKYKN
jgi:hypothetical protein